MKVPKLYTDNAPGQVNHGLLRLGEVEQVQTQLTEHLGIQLTVVDAKQRFLAKLAGISNPETKRKIIGNEFIEVFQETAAKIEEAAKNSSRAGTIDWLLQGTLYPDGSYFPHPFFLCSSQLKAPKRCLGTPVLPLKA